MEVTDGRQLKAARAILGLTMREMADAAGVNRNTVCRAEGKRSLSRRSFAARQLGRTLEDLGIFCETVEGDAVIRFSKEAPQ